MKRNIVTFLISICQFVCLIVFHPSSDKWHVHFDSHWQLELHAHTENSTFRTESSSLRVKPATKSRKHTPMFQVAIFPQYFFAASRQAQIGAQSSLKTRDFTSVRNKTLEMIFSVRLTI